MADMTVLQVEVPSDLLQEVRNISVSFHSDLNDDIVHLMECYAESFRRLRSDPAAKVLLKE